MKHILCITSGLRGILFASFELVKRLEKAGFRVTYASPRAVGELVERNGISFKSLAEVNYFPAPDLPNFSGPLAKVQRLWYRWSRRSRLQEAAVENLGMDQFRDILEDIKPDLVLIDVELHEHLMTSISQQIPTLLLSQWFSLWKQDGLPPLVHDTIPQQGWRGSRLGMQLAWWRIYWQRAWMFGKKQVRTAGTNRRMVLCKYAASIGFPSRYLPDNYWPGPFTYAELPVLSMTLEEMEFPHTKRSNLYYVGPMIAENRQDSLPDQQLRERLALIFQEKVSHQKALLCCTVSSFKAGDSVFLQRLVQAVKNRPEWLLIIGLGSKLTTADLGELPPNVHAFPWIPQTSVLAQADCSINHGGIHTINECVHFQVPMLVYSGKRSDQNGCAARVHYHGLGIMADKDQDSSAAIELNIHKILSTPTYRERLLDLYQHYQAYREEDILSSYVKQLMREGTHSRQRSRV